MTHKEFIRKLRYWLRDEIKFPSMFDEYVGTDGINMWLRTTLPFKLSPTDIQKISYSAYKNHFVLYLQNVKKQFSFNIYFDDKTKQLDFWISALNKNLTSKELNKCKTAIKNFIKMA